MSEGYPYTVDEAQREIGDSTDWCLGLEVAIKKWEQIVGGNVNDYEVGECCGICYVAGNRGPERCDICKHTFPAMKHLCDSGKYVRVITPKRMLAYMRSSLTRFRKTLEEK